MKRASCKTRIICVKRANDCLLRSAGLNSPAGGEKKQREREKKQRLPTTIMRSEQITQMETDAHLSGENSIHIVTRFCRSVQMQHCINMRLLLICFFYWNFLLTRMTASVASTHHAHVPTHSTRSWRWRERDRHTLHSSTGISSI